MIWIGEDREPDLSFEYEAILRSLYPEDFVDSVVANDETAAIFLGGPIKHEKHGDLIIRYAVGPERVGVMGLLSKTGKLKASDAGALRSWLTRLRKELDAGKEVYVSLNDKSEPLFMRALRDGNFQIHDMYSHEYPFGVWKTVRVSKSLEEQEEFTDPTTGRFWGNAGAGGLFYAKDTSRYLIAKRSSLVNEPNTWGTWGGKIDGDETPEEALEREIREETGYSGGYDLQWLYTYQDGGFRFDNYLIVVPQEFEPTHSWETSGHKWVEFGDWPKPLHFGLKALIPHIPHE